MASFRCILFKTPLTSKLSKQVSVCQTRCLNLLEYQSKMLLQDNEVCIQRFKIVENAEEAKSLLQNFKVAEYVVKAQILAGGRGLGYFDNGFKGGVHLTNDPSKVMSVVEKMVGQKLVTSQTPKDGITVKKVMVAESVKIKRETYFCILMDRIHNGPVLIASPCGGMDIENVAEKSPHLIKTVPVDIFEGISDKLAFSIADFLQFEGKMKDKAVIEIKNLWKLFCKVDAVQLEINPFVETTDGFVVSVDAKLQFDDNAKFRQKNIFDLEDVSESDPREVEASLHNLNYIGMTGNIGCLVNGAGLAMATMDIIKLHGGEPANFLDVGGGVTEKQVYDAFRILTSDKNVKAILVNVFGGIVNCATIANGIIKACLTIQLNIPLIVRLEGTNVEEARGMLEKSAIPVLSAKNLEDAANKAVVSLKK